MLNVMVIDFLCVFLLQKFDYDILNFDKDFIMEKVQFILLDKEFFKIMN